MLGGSQAIHGADDQGHQCTNPSMTKNLRGQVVQAREVIAESPPPPPTRSKRLRKRPVTESDKIEEPATVPNETSGIDEELRKAFEAVEHEKEVDALTGDKKKGKEVERKEHSAAVPEPEVEAEHSVVVPVPKDRTVGTLAVVTNPFKPPIVAPPLLHKENMAPRPILEISLGLARDVLNLHNRYEDLKPSFNASEFCKATHESNLAYYQKHKADLDVLVADYKETKSIVDELEKHIEELQKQLAGLRERQLKLGARLGTKTKATFLVQNMISTSRPALDIVEASIH
ncbi:unnamed protein product [Prunus armeniaca]